MPVSSTCRRRPTEERSTSLVFVDVLFEENFRHRSSNSDRDHHGAWLFVGGRGSAVGLVSRVE